MSLFGKKNTKEKKPACSCGGNCNAESMATAVQAKKEGARIKILGGGCTKCKQLETSTKAALEHLNMNTDVEHITDFVQIAAYGVMSTPALVVDEKVVSYGKVLSIQEVTTILQTIRK